jgi:hypothetical protein
MKSFHVGALHANREECEGLGGLSFLYESGRIPPFIGRTSVGNQEHPRPPIPDTIGTIDLLSTPQHTKSYFDCRA